MLSNGQEWYSLVFFRVGVEENQQNKRNLLGAFGEDKPDPAPSLEFRLGSSLSGHDHWADTCSQWEALNFGHKAAAWDTSQKENHLLQKPELKRMELDECEQNGAGGGGACNSTIACPLSNRGAYLPLEPWPCSTYLQ